MALLAPCSHSLSLSQLLIAHLKNENNSRQNWLLVTEALMSPGTASDDPGPGASQGQEETGLETQPNFPEILLGEEMLEMLAGLKWSA